MKINIYLSNEGHIKIYSFLFDDTFLINEIELKYPTKVIVSEDNNIIVLVKKIFKINNPETSKDIEIIGERIKNFEIKIFSDILEVKKIIFVLSLKILLASKILETK